MTVTKCCASSNKQSERLSEVGVALVHLFSCASLALVPGAVARAAETSAVPNQQVEVIGDSTEDERTDPSLARFVIGREDLRRFGDTNLADVLRRIQGISIVQGPGRSVEVRLRGLGAGYTQVLLNGEPAPPGFSIDSVSPDIVDRVEVVRSASAESSAQSIAGSINIVLRRQVRADQRNFRLSASTYSGLASAAAGGELGGRAGSFGYSASANLNLDRDRWPSTTSIGATDGRGVPLFERVTLTREDGRRLSLGIVPRATWKPQDSRSLTIDGLLQVQRFDFGGSDDRTVQSGNEPEFLRNDLAFRNETLQARISSIWKSAITQDSHSELKLTLSHFRRSSSSVLNGFDADIAPVLVRNVESLLQDSSLSTNGKYAWGIANGLSFSSGWEGQWSRRTENRIQRETSTAQRPTEDLDEDYDALVTRMATFAQVDWLVSDAVSTYIGMRWEGLLTRTRGNELTPVHKRSSVVSPTFQWLWKIPDSKSDQLRVALARTYKAPTARQLIPRRWVVTDNTATSPDFQGNPDLVPELAWGVDVGYERHLANNGFFSVSIYARHIRDVILERTFVGTGGNWISSPFNEGKASVRGIEVEARSNLRALWTSASDVDLRAGFSRNLSRVYAVPPPGNRLNQQPSLTMTFGADFRPSNSPLTLGTSFSFEKGDFFRTSQERSGINPYKRNVDAYGLWSLNKDTRVRLTIGNLLRTQSVTQSRYDDNDLLQAQRAVARSFVSVRLGVDFRL